MGLALIALFGCGWDAAPHSPPGSYDISVRDDLPGPAGTGDAVFAGSLGPPDVMVAPVETGPATTTREGSGGPPILPAGAEPTPPTRYRLEGPNQDAHRSTTRPSP